MQNVHGVSVPETVAEALAITMLFSLSLRA